MPLLSMLKQIPYTGACGVCRVSDLVLSDNAKENIERLCPNAACIGVVLFPYLVRSSASDRNLSLYACSNDYHTVLSGALTPVCENLKSRFPNYSFIPLIDSSPIPEVQAAWKCGAGILGKNGLIFDPLYGSYVFIGTVLTDLPCKLTKSSLKTCIGCKICMKSCPLSALGEKGSVNCSLCLSDITQSKHELDKNQLSALKNHPLIWGCDICSDVCPMNKNVPDTPNPAFHKHRIEYLSLDDVSGLTRRQFLQKYPDRAFTWRGPKPLQRNLELHRDL